VRDFFDGVWIFDRGRVANLLSEPTMEFNKRITSDTAPPKWYHVNPLSKFQLAEDSPAAVGVLDILTGVALSLKNQHGQ
jgi:hypothetical protein